MKKIKIFLALLIVLLNAETGFAQAGRYAYSHLSLPPSAHVSALGGTNISLHDDDINFTLQNPALLTQKMHKAIALNATNYVADVFFGSVSGAWAFTGEHFVGVGVQFVDYGDFLHTDEYDNAYGNFTARDLAFHLMYAHRISPNITVGATMKPIYSSYQNYNSFALAFDMGANYFVEENDLSLGLVLKNIGFQFTGFYTDDDGDQYRERLPVELQFGVSKRLANAPFRVSATLVNLQRWDMSYRNDAKQGSSLSNSNKQSGEDLSFLDNAIRHIVLGVDFIPNEQFFLTAGYNVRRAREMQVVHNRSFAGFSLGGGLKLHKFQLGFAFAQNHPKNNSLSFSVATNLQSWGKRL
ncbi:MAG: type IX secretion system protein PorQ [Prevotellaceae bacterium]|jgi:hypothetical protein|nr:type IX secretion system protein PorQ [Prevotellaceae bacterium]